MSVGRRGQAEGATGALKTDTLSGARRCRCGLTNSPAPSYWP